MAKMTLDKSDYERGLQSASADAKKSANDLKKALEGHKYELQESLKASKELYAQNKITFGQFKEDISKINGELNVVNQQISEVDGTTAKTTTASKIGWLAVATAIIGVTKKIIDLGLETERYADNIGDLAEKWGFTTKEIQEFDYVATMNGTTLETLLTGMRGLVNQAEAGSSAFKKLGVNVRQANGNFKDQRTLFLETMTALQGIEDKVQRNALQFEIFGRAGIELGQVINLTGEEIEEFSRKAEELGLIISETAIKSASNLNDQFDTMKAQFRSLIAEIFAGTPESAEKLDNFITGLGENIIKNVPRILKFVLNLAMNLINAVAEQLPDLITKLIDTIVDFLVSLDWLKILANVIYKIAEAIVVGVWEAIQKVFGKGWLWGTNDNQITATSEQTSNVLNTITTSNVTERTSKVDEKLEISLNVESDGTVAGEKNLDIISDLMVDKINKALGDLVNG